jgi:sulfur-oxidizing protein SoxX
MRSLRTRLAKTILTSLVFTASLQTPLVCAEEESLRPFVITGDAILEPLTGVEGNPARGRALVLERSSACLLCHGGPYPEQRFQGDLAPQLSGTGRRWSQGQLRLRLVDASRLNPATIMPSYYRANELYRVANAWRGKPILSAEQIEDVVSYLVTLRD